MSISLNSNLILYSSLTYNNSNSKRPKPSAEVVEIQQSLSSGIKKLEDLSKEELNTLKTFESADMAAFKAEIFENMSKAQAIARKIAKGEALTPEEEKFISENFPEIKKEASKAKEEGEELSRKVRAAKSKKEADSYIMSATVASTAAIKAGASPIAAELKLVAIESAKQKVEGEEEYHKNSKNIKNKSGSFINSIA